MMSDPAQFETFLAAYQDMVFSTAARLLGNDAEAEDVAQEVFVRAWNHFGDLMGSPTAGGWLKTVTRNLCLNHLQRYRARWKMFSDLAREDDEGETRELEFAAPDTLQDTLLTADQRTLIEHVLAKLPADQRVALALYHFEDMDYADIATQLGVSLGKVKTDIFRARETLRKKLQPDRESVGV
jgi:RNA polymerase sigma-70 factor (ECF subfamily)